MKIEFEDLSTKNRSTFNQIRKDLSIMKFIHVADNYYEYLMSSTQIMYKLIKLEGIYVGGLHIEMIDDYATFSIEIMNDYQRNGISTHVVNLLKHNFFNLNIKMYKIYCETLNHPSIALFTNSGFEQTGIEDGIQEFIYKI